MIVVVENFSEYSIGLLPKSIKVDTSTKKEAEWEKQTVFVFVIDKKRSVSRQNKITSEIGE